jgi:tetratricopeptide (TPR) repeat protein
MSSYKLFGDAKATAKEADPLRKSKQVTAAKEKLDANPSAENRINYASALFEAGRYAEAESVLTELLSGDGADNLQALFELGFVYKHLKRNVDAINMFKRIVTLNPKHDLARTAEEQIWRLDPSYKPSWMSK